MVDSICSVGVFTGGVMLMMRWCEVVMVRVLIATNRLVVVMVLVVLSYD